MTRTVLAAACALLAVLTGCSTTSSTSSKSSLAFKPAFTPPKNPANVKLKLSTGAQRLYMVEGDTVLLATPVGVGKASSPTPHGTFRIYSKQANRRRISSPGAGYPMPFWMEFKPAYGMHWGFVKPYPSTMGCVRIPLQAAGKIFDTIRVGTPLVIAKSQPWDATIGKSLPVLDDTKLPDPPMSYLMSPQVFADMRKGKLWTF